MEKGKSHSALGKGHNKSHWTIRRVFHNVPLTREYFGLCWRGVYYVWTAPCFRWCASPYIYHSLGDAVAQYVRSQDIPTSAWLDNYGMSNPRATRDLSPTGQRRQLARRWPSHSRYFTTAVTSWRFQNANWNPPQTWSF